MGRDLDYNLDVKELKSLIDKSRPVKVSYIFEDKYNSVNGETWTYILCECPICGNNVQGIYENPNYCSRCGQRIEF